MSNLPIIISQNFHGTGWTEEQEKYLTIVVDKLKKLILCLPKNY